MTLPDGSIDTSMDPIMPVNAQGKPLTQLGDGTVPLSVLMLPLTGCQYTFNGQVITVPKWSKVVNIKVVSDPSKKGVGEHFNIIASNSDVQQYILNIIAPS